MKTAVNWDQEAAPPKASLPVLPYKKIVSIVSILFIFIVFLMPIYRLVALSFQAEEGISFANYASILQDVRTWIVLKNTVFIVIGSTAISVVLGITFAWLVAYTDLRAKKLLQIMIILPFVIPSYISTLAWTQFLGANGILHQAVSLLPVEFAPINLYSMGGIIFVLGLSHYPLVYLLSVSVLRKIPREMEQAARVSGASRKRTLMKVTLPLALPGIASGGFLAFLANLDNFGIPAFLGIPANISVLSTYIYQQVVGFGTSAFARAATLSVILGGIALTGTLIQWLLLRKSKRIETTVEDKEPRYFLGNKRVLVEALLWIFFFITSIVPLISMGMTSLISAYGLDFTWQNISLKNYDFVLNTSTKAKQALFHSLQLALFTSLIGIIIGTAFAYYRIRKPNRLNKLSEIAISLPYALPGTVMALSMIFTWMEPVPGWNPGIYGSIVILFIAYFTRFLILQVRGSLTAVMQVDISIEEAAQVSGSNGWSKWRKVLLPLLFPGVISGAFLVFLTALTELTISSLLWSSNSETIGVVIFGYEQAGYTTYSTAFSSLIVGLIIAGFLFLYGMEKWWKRKVVKQA